MTLPQTLPKGPAEARPCPEAAVRDYPMGRIGLYELFWVFFLTSGLGALCEIVFCRFSMGWFMSRSGVLYGQFSLVWGVGAVLFTLLFCRRGTGRPAVIFCAGTAVGAVYEYACSWLQEAAFGASFWDYSHLPLNLNGRINLAFCLFWGGAALLWAKAACPLIRRWIGCIPGRVGRPLTLCLALLMAANIALSGAALLRSGARRQDVPAQNAVEAFLDRHYPDQRLKESFPTLRWVEDGAGAV